MQSNGTIPTEVSIEELVGEAMQQPYISFHGRLYHSNMIPLHLRAMMYMTEQYRLSKEFLHGIHRDGHSDIGIGPLHRDTHVDYTAART